MKHLDRATLLYMHGRVIGTCGGRRGVRDSLALSEVVNSALLDTGDVYDLAIVYARGLIVARPFCDANLATAWCALVTTLSVNKRAHHYTATHNYRMFLRYARGRITTDEFKHWLVNARPQPRVNQTTHSTN